MTVTAAVKVRENRLRRAADRQGKRLVKSNRRDPRATDFALFWLVPLGANPSGPGMTLDDVEAQLNGEGT